MLFNRAVGSRMQSLRYDNVFLSCHLDVDKILYIPLNVLQVFVNLDEEIIVYTFNWNFFDGE